MPSLRERLERVRKYAKWCSPSTYRLLKALVEAVEVEAVEPEDTEACVATLTLAYDGAKVRIDCLRKLLAEAKAEIETLRQEYDAAKDEHEAYKTAARDRIYNLRKECDEWAKKVVAQANAGRLFVVPNQEFEADAEIGRLVRGMREETCLWRGGDGCYAARTLLLSALSRPILKSDFMTGVQSRDPADALRRIQEVGDGES